MRKLEIVLYSFDELSKDVQETVLKQQAEINFECGEWWETVYEDANDIGVQIKSFDTERGKIRLNDQSIDFESTAKLILENHGPKCASYDAAAAFIKGDCKNVMLFLRDLENYYLKMLQSEIDYRYSNEGIKETIEALEMEFLKNGTVWNGTNLTPKQ